MVDDFALSKSRKRQDDRDTSLDRYGETQKREESGSARSERKSRYRKDYFVTKPWRRLKIAYANIRFVRTGIAFKMKQDDPNVKANATYITNREQIGIHMRGPVYDEDNNLEDEIDVDLYLPKDQRFEIAKVTEGRPIEKTQAQILTTEQMADMRGQIGQSLQELIMDKTARRFEKVEKMVMTGGQITELLRELVTLQIARETSLAGRPLAVRIQRHPPRLGRMRARGRPRRR